MEISGLPDGLTFLGVSISLSSSFDSLIGGKKKCDS